MQVRWTEDAAEDLLAISDYVSSTSPEIAREICEELYAAAGDLAAMPYRGRARDASPLRELVVTRLGYIIFYRIDIGIVTIIRIIHGAREWRPV